ncbi:autotransporter domain-containing protein [Myxococcota bacterium]|nr:autotransporter domain-containing protein [Myxococcota bacterium]
MDDGGGGGGGLNAPGGLGIGGGGGFAGAGGNGIAGDTGAGGGGGGASFFRGSDGSSETGGNGGGSNGGVGGTADQAGDAGGSISGGGGGGPLVSSSGTNGGDGGASGGGGGATGNGNAGHGGEFGGGGGALSGDGGDGGFGAGGGGSVSGAGGSGGTGGGEGSNLGGGQGGNSWGGAIFVREGAELFLVDSSLGSGTANSVQSPALSNGATRTEGADLYLSNGVIATVTVSAGETSRSTGSISGAGGLTKQGDGTLIFSAINDYQASTTVEGGTLQGSTKSFPTDIAVAAGATVQFDEATDATFENVLSGSGNLVKSGAGTLTFDSNQTLSGGASVEGGGLALTNGIDFDSDVSLSDGTTLSLESNSRIQGGVVVASGATLSGNGRIRDDFIVGGTVDPGPSIATIEVADGSLTLESGMVLVIDANADQESDLIDVQTGNAQLNGGRIELALASGDYSEEKIYTLVSAASVNGAAPSPPSDFAFQTISVQTTPTQLQLVVTPDPTATFANFAQTPNQYAIGLVLDAVGPTPTGDLKNVIDAFKSGLTDPEVIAGLDELTGAPLTGYDTATLDASRQFREVVARRLRIRKPAPADTPLTNANPVRGLGTPVLYASSEAMWPLPSRRDGTHAPLGSSHEPQPPSSPLGLITWLDGFGAFGTVDGDPNATGFDYDVGGVALGVEMRPMNALRVGASGGYGHTSLEFDRHESSGDIDNYHAALYGAWGSEHAYAGAIARYTRDDFESRRPIQIGTLQRTANASFDGNEISAYIETGVDLASYHGVQFTPMAFFEWVRLERNAFTETGADSIDLQVDANDLDSKVAAVGLRLHGALVFDEDYRLLPEIWGRYEREFGDTDRRIVGRLSGTDLASPFEIVGIAPARNTGSIGIGWLVETPNSFRVFGQYEIAINDAYTRHGIRAGVQVVW